MKYSWYSWSYIQVRSRPHICHRYHRLYAWRKICHVEKFQISVKNLNNLWSFIEIYAVFVLNLCGEKSVWRKSVWRKKWQIWGLVGHSIWITLHCHNTWYQCIVQCMDQRQYQSETSNQIRQHVHFGSPENISYSEIICENGCKDNKRGLAPQAPGRQESILHKKATLVCCYFQPGVVVRNWTLTTVLGHCTPFHWSTANAKSSALAKPAWVCRTDSVSAVGVE